MKKPAVALLALAAILVGCETNERVALGPAGPPYQAPLESVGAKFGRLPPAVQRSIRAEVGAAEITDIVQDTSRGQKVYRVYVRQERDLPPLTVADDGSVLNPDLTVAVGAGETPGGLLAGRGSANLSIASLPLDVRKTLLNRAPAGATVEDIAKQAWGDREVYVIKFSDPSTPTLYVTSDGMVMTQSR